MKSLQKLSAALLALLLLAGHAFAQCPDPSPSAPGLYPNPMPPGTQGQLYPATGLTVVFPTDTLVSVSLGGFFTLDLPITYTRYDYVEGSGLPMGIDFDTTGFSAGAGSFALSGGVNRACIQTADGSTILHGTFNPAIRFRRNGTATWPGLPLPLPGLPNAGDVISLDSLPGLIAGFIPPTVFEFGASTVLVIADDPNFCDLMPNAFNTQVCPNGAGLPAQLSMTGAADYTWLPDDGSLNTTTGANVLANPTVTTVYTVTGSDPGGCVGTATIKVEVKVPELQTFSNVPGVCPDSLVKLWATGASSYTWAPANLITLTVGDTVYAKITTTKTFTVTGATSFGCNGTGTITIEAYPLPDNQLPVTYSADVCVGQPAEVVLGSSQNGIIYIMGNSAGQQVGQPRFGNGQDQTFTIPANQLQPGLNQFALIGIDGNTQCATLIGGVIAINYYDGSDIFIDGLPEVHCLNDGTFINVTGIPSGGQFSVNDQTITGNEIDLSLLDAGKNVVTYTVNAPCGAVSKQQEFILGAYLPSFEPNTTVYSAGKPLTFNNTTPGDLTGATYTWKVNGEVKGTSKNLNWTLPIDATEQDVYNIELTISYGGQCPATSDILAVSVNNTSLDDELTAAGVSIYPNPSNGRFTVATPAGFTTIKVTDIQGKTLFNAANKGGATAVELKNAPAGSYFLHIQAGEKTYVRQIVVK